MADHLSLARPAGAFDSGYSRSGRRRCGCAVALPGRRAATVRPRQHPRRTQGPERCAHDAAPGPRRCRARDRRLLHSPPAQDIATSTGDRERRANHGAIHPSGRPARAQRSRRPHWRCLRPRTDSSRLAPRPTHHRRGPDLLRPWPLSMATKPTRTVRHHCATRRCHRTPRTECRRAGGPHSPRSGRLRQRTEP